MANDKLLKSEQDTKTLINQCEAKSATILNLEHQLAAEVDKNEELNAKLAAEIDKNEELNAQIEDVKSSDDQISDLYEPRSSASSSIDFEESKS